MEKVFPNESERETQMRLEAHEGESPGQKSSEAVLSPLLPAAGLHKSLRSKKPPTTELSFADRLGK